MKAILSLFTHLIVKILIWIFLLPLFYLTA
jgi:hypothetical protein